MADDDGTISLEIVTCAFCQKAILENEPFVEVSTITGVQLLGDTYVSRGPNLRWSKTESYIHLTHLTNGG